MTVKIINKKIYNMNDKIYRYIYLIELEWMNVTHRKNTYIKAKKMKLNIFYAHCYDHHH